MKKLIFVPLLAFGLFACNTAEIAETDYTSMVDPFIGTGGHGHTFPGPVVPNGMIQPSPDTRIDGWDACSGYYYEDSSINWVFAYTCKRHGMCRLWRYPYYAYCRRTGL